MDFLLALEEVAKTVRRINNITSMIREELVVKGGVSLELLKQLLSDNSALEKDMKDLFGRLIDNDTEDFVFPIFGETVFETEAVSESVKETATESESEEVMEYETETTEGFETEEESETEVVVESKKLSCPYCDSSCYRKRYSSK